MSNTAEPGWKAVYLLPNISLRNPIGQEYIALAGSRDDRVTAIRTAHPAVDQMLSRFTDQFGVEIRPTILMIRADAPSGVDAEAIVSFRNAIALCSIVRSKCILINNNNSYLPLFSDYFDFYPYTFNKDFDAIVNLNPTMMAFHTVDDFIGQSSPVLTHPSSIRILYDEDLLNLIMLVWNRRFLKVKRDEWKTRVVFRSMEMAYQATKAPLLNRASIYDWGSSVALWVSAFEVLTRTFRQKTDLLKVLDLLNTSEWRNPKLQKKKYEHWKGAKISKLGLPLPNNLIMINQAGRFYKELYLARNDFIHGNRVTSSRLFPFKNKRYAPLTEYAPLIYRAALTAYLKQFVDRRIHISTNQILLEIFSYNEYETAFSTVTRRR